MSLVASKLMSSFSGVTWLSNATGATLITIGNVTDVDFNEDGEVLAFIGDASLRATAKKMVNNNVTAKVVGASKAIMDSIPIGQPGTLVAVLNDFYNGVGTGAITYTLVNAMKKSNHSTGQNNKIAVGEVMFESFSVDGVASPLSSVVAA